MDDRNYAHIGIYRDHGLVGFQGSSATEGDFVDAIYATSSSCMMLWWLSKALSGFGMFLRPQSTGPKCQDYNLTCVSLLALEIMRSCLSHAGVARCAGGKYIQCVCSRMWDQDCFAVSRG